MELKIDPEFQNLIPPLKDEEFKILKNDIRINGCHDAITSWNGFIIDGHNRYKICTGETPNIHFDVKEITFPDRDAVMVWMINHQLGRRNLEPIDKVPLAERLDEIERKMAKERQITLAGTRPKSDLVENFPQGEGTGKSRDKVAEKLNISGKTYEHLKKVQKSGVDELLQAVREKTIGAESAAVISSLPIEEQKSLVKAGRKAMIQKAKELKPIIRPSKPKQKTQKEDKQEITQCGTKEGSQIIKPLGHEVAMKYARMAVLQLESIHRNDHDKDEAFDFVIEWINQHR